ncbi:MAG: CotH kinase family protein [Flavobacteriales bacterium]|nr:CotH kinase family protein [Flavobacteriales bacterium]
MNRVLAVIAILGLISCENRETIVFCDAETVAGGDIICGDDTLSGGQNITAEEAYSGVFSLKLNEGKPYGFGYVLKQPNLGEKYLVSVYLKGKAILIVSGKEIYIRKEIESNESDWEKHTISFRVPIYNQSSINIFCWNPYEEPAYFDDFEISNGEPKKNGLETLHFLMHPGVLDNIRKNRAIAINQKLITKDLKQYQKAYLNQKPIKIRLKGDWTDHVAGDKFSFRVKSKHAIYQDMSRFSVQSPEMRYFLHEWVYHKMLEEEGILTTSYSFCNVSINEINMGIHTVEEHLSKSLLARYDIGSGAILKYDETLFFEGVKSTNSENLLIEQCDIKIYQPFKKLDSIQLKTASRLVNAYTSASLPIDSIFDLRKLAKFLAVVDLNKAYHSVRWHNMRWYFNSETSLLEPIGYDGIGSGGVSKRNNVGLIFDLPKGNNLIDDLYIHQHLENEEFRLLYLKFCKEVAAESYIASFIKKYEEEIRTFEKIIQADFPEYTYDYNFLKESAQQMVKSMNQEKKR